jgi:hypothetical protein
MRRRRVDEGEVGSGDGRGRARAPGRDDDAEKAYAQLYDRRRTDLAVRQALTGGKRGERSGVELRLGESAIGTVAVLILQPVGD